MAILNTRLMSHPLNWAIFMLMVLIAGSLGHLGLSLAGIEPASKAKRSAWDEMPAGQSPGEAAAGAITPQGTYQA